jgi:hypothetical protein
MHTTMHCDLIVEEVSGCPGNQCIGLELGDLLLELLYIGFQTSAFFPLVYKLLLQSYNVVLVSGHQSQCRLSMVLIPIFELLENACCGICYIQKQTMKHPKQITIGCLHAFTIRRKPKAKTE